MGCSSTIIIYNYKKIYIIIIYIYMSIRDFVKKHKGKLVAASGILASLLAMAALTEKRKRERRAYLGVANIMRGEPDPRWNPVIQDAPPAMIEPAEPIVRPRRHSEPVWIPVPHRERRYSEEEYKRPRDGRGKNNSLLKAVQAYRKKHGCSLKEAWAAVR
jgi:hypothetical protein